MKKNFLLTLGLLLGSAAGLNAQVMVQDFESEQGADNTAVGWYEFINNQEGDTREIFDLNGNKVMHFYNTLVDTTSWRRAIKFRNLPLKENTSYRVTFELCGDNTYNVDGSTDVKSKAHVALMRGQENGDLPFLAANDKQFAYDISYFQTPDQGAHKYTMMFYAPTKDVMETYYASHPGEIETLADKYFLTMNVFSPGDYYIDNVKVEESEIAGITFNNDVIKVDFGYAVNAKALLTAAGKKKLVLPEGTAKVMMDGKEINVLTTEIQEDGNLYIFLDDEYPETGTEKIEVSFKNPTDAAYQLLYTDDLRPRSLVEGDTKIVSDFSAEVGTYDELLEGVSSSAYDTPVLVTADPEDGSFDLPLTTTTFKLSYDKGVDAAKAKATLVNENGQSEELTVAPNEGFVKDLTLTRTKTEALAKGEYKLNITHIYPERSLGDDIFGESTIVLNFGEGGNDPNDTARVVLVDSFAVKGANYIPEGWDIYTNKVKKTVGSAGSGPRIFNFTAGGDFTFGLYTRSESGDENADYAEYGNEEKHLLALTPGKYQLTFNAAAWKGTPYVKCEIYDPSGTVLTSSTDACLPNLNGNMGASTASSTKVTIDFRVATEGNYKVRWTPVTSTGGLGAWNEIILANIKMQYIPAVAGVYEKNLLASAIENAKKCMDTNSGERYAGEAFTALKEMIEKYDGKHFTAPSVYKNAAAELNAAVEKMKAHRTLIDKYDPMAAAGQAVLDQFATSKFNSTDYYNKLKTVVEKYTGKLLTDDKELEAAIAELTSATNYCKNMCTTGASNCGTTGVAALTARLVMGANTLKKLGAAEDDALVVAAQNALDDDDALAQQIKSDIIKRLYKEMADPASKLFEEKVDTVTLDTYVDSIDVTTFLKNPNIYIKTNNRTDMAAENCPGWTVKTGEGYEVAWTTGWSWVIGNDSPVADGMLSNWAKSYELTQTITDLPAGIYTLKAGFGERNTLAEGAEPLKNYFFYETSTAKDSVLAPVIGQTFPVSNLTFKDVEIVDGKLTIGVKAAGDAHTFANNFQLFLKNKSAKFDYATSIKGVVDEKENATLKDVEYYDLNGRRVNGIVNGVTLIKKVYANGTVKVQKVLKK